MPKIFRGPLGESMTQDQEKKLLDAVKRIEYNLEHLLRYASAMALKLDVLGVQPPQPRDVRKTRT